jgi:phage major head subunit gpT-like protein
MIITPQTMSVFFTAAKALFNDGWDNAPSHAFEVAMKVSTGSLTGEYGWVGQFPQMREWIGDRYLKNLIAYDYSIKNLPFESTVKIPRASLEDDQYGLFSPMFRNMGRMTRLHPDTLVFNLLKKGFATPCYDDLPFFNAAHPSFDGNGNEITFSNVQSGAGPAWFLLDTTQAIKPVIFQERIPYEFQTVTHDTDAHVFLNDEFLYGVRARLNVGFGFWQMAFGSQAPLTAVNYAAARAAMQTLMGDQGQYLAVNPNLLVVPPALEADARMLLKATSVTSDASFDTGSGVVTGGIAAVSNIWHDSANLIVTPFVA